MNKKWVKIKSFEEFFLAEIIKGKLLERNIPVIMLNKKDNITKYDLFSGSIDLFVERKSKEKALKILEAS